MHFGLCMANGSRWLDSEFSKEVICYVVRLILEEAWIIIQKDLFFAVIF
jgi:hypothetical protein